MALSLFQFLDLLLPDLMSTSLFHQVYILSLICWLINNSTEATRISLKSVDLYENPSRINLRGVGGWRAALP